jgi:hypothetical protein
VNPSDRFDAAYYRRHYQGPRRAHGAAEVARLAGGICGLLDWYRVDLRAVLDVGAGPGFWRDWFKKHRPSVRYRSTDFSPYACQRYGHERRDISRWRSRERHDLIVCQSVVQYLDDAACAKALSNLGAMCRGFLYLETVTRRDLATVLDLERSDTDFVPRSGAWYRRRLARDFVQLGAGLWASKRCEVGFYELETCR